MPVRYRFAFHQLRTTNNDTPGSPASGLIFRLAKHTSTLGLLLLTAGCAVGPDYAGLPELHLPSHWSDESSTTRHAHVLGGCWLRLRDPLLSQLVKEAVEANPSVTKAKAAVREARSTIDETSAA